MGDLVEQGTLSANQPVVLLITTSSLEEARAIIDQLVGQRAVACATILKGVESVYWWQGKIESSVETLIIAKTIAGNVETARRITRSIHSYQVFELIVLPIAGGNEAYLQWIAEETNNACYR